MRDSQIGEEGDAVGEKENRIDALQVALREKESQIAALEATVREKESRIGDLEVGLREKDSQIGKLETAVGEIESRVRELEAVLREKDAYIQHIQSGHGWRLLIKYFRVRDRLFPEGTKRRVVMKLLFRLLSRITHENAKKALTYVRLYGWQGFLRKIRGRLQDVDRTADLQREGARVPFTPIIDLQGLEDDVGCEEVKISVILPAKNAGEDFDYVLRMIRMQRGIKDLEIVVVDSGSSDETMRIARHHGAIVVEIQPGDFSHSYSRNAGAEKASADYLFFTVQDALLPSNDFLYTFYKTMKNSGVAAVSCVEFCREDADLFCRVMAWSHARFLGVDKEDRILSMPDNPTWASMRKNAQLSHTACLIHREVFDRYRFRLDYGEDLDLGIRLVRDGHRLALLGSTRIIHSHNRPPFYFLKRGYVDNRHLAIMLPDFPLPEVRWEQLRRDIALSYHVLDAIIQERLTTIEKPCSVDHFIGLVRDAFAATEKKGGAGGPIFDKHGCVDGELEEFIRTLSSQIQDEECAGPYQSIIIRAISDFNETLFEFMKHIYGGIDEHIFGQFIHCLYKTFAFSCGSHIAYCERKDVNNKDQRLKKIARELSREI